MSDVIELLNEFNDPLDPKKTLHPLSTILFISICAIFGGVEGWGDIVLWEELHKDWLKNMLILAKEYYVIAPPTVVAGHYYDTRKMLLKFISDSLLDIEEYMPHRIKPVRKTLENKADKILGFVKTLEDELAIYADELDCDIYWLWQICYAQRFSKDKSNYYQHIAKAKSRLKNNFYHIEQSVIATMNEIEKASSVVENLNGRVRKFLRNHIHVSQEMLELFRFIINSSVFERSRCAHRHGKSPSEVLHDKPHQHWLELLGYKLFKQAA